MHAPTATEQPCASTLFGSLQSRKTLSEMPTTVAGSLTMRSCGQFCQASASMNLIPDSTLTCRRRGTLQRSLPGHFSLASWGHELLAECDGWGNPQVLLEMAGQHYSFEKR